MVITPKTTDAPLHALVNVLYFKITATVLFWCVPFLTFPPFAIEFLGFPPQDHWMFIRMLGWAYLALCVGYWFALLEAKRGRRLLGALWMGVVSNGGACGYLTFYGAIGLWDTWGAMAQVILWGSALATALITAGLVRYGLRDG